MLALSIGDILIIYLIPVVAFVVLWLGVSALVYLLVRSRLDFAFKHDLLHKFEKRRVLPSGTDRFTFMYVSMLLLGDSCIQATLLYRISRFFQRHRLRTLAQVVHAFSRFLTHSDISPQANIGPGFYLYHGIGTAIGKGSQIGKRVIICHDVSISGAVTLGDDVKIWPGAQILPRVRIGDRSEVGANAVVIGDFPPDSIVFGVPARVTGTRSFFALET
jgi:serine O-acetyltransferase